LRGTSLKALLNIQLPVRDGQESAGLPWSAMILKRRESFAIGTPESHFRNWLWN